MQSTGRKQGTRSSQSTFEGPLYSSFLVSIESLRYKYFPRSGDVHTVWSCYVRSFTTTRVASSSVIRHLICYTYGQPCVRRIWNLQHFSPSFETRKRKRRASTRTHDFKTSAKAKKPVYSGRSYMDLRIFYHPLRHPLVTFVVVFLLLFAVIQSAMLRFI